MILLAIETSCDETAAAVLDGPTKVLSDVVYSQVPAHRHYGGVVPEIASRKHVQKIMPVVTEALERAGKTMDTIEAVAATYGPGLIGSLLVGLSVAKAIAYAREIPFAGVNHVEGHLLSALLSEPEGDALFPFVGLVVSGGHTSLFLAESFGHYQRLGRTLDDAAGEAYDKVAKHLGLGYPGGAIIDKLGREGNPTRLRLPRPMLAQPGLDFSFSGLKTAVVHATRRCGAVDDGGPATADVAASFQEAVVDVLVGKCLRACEQTGVGRLVVCGGVAANSRLRERLAAATEAKGVRLAIPPLRLCTDNAAMIGAVGARAIERGRTSSLDLNADSSLRL